MNDDSTIEYDKRITPPLPRSGDVWSRRQPGLGFTETAPVGPVNVPDRPMDSWVAWMATNTNPREELNGDPKVFGRYEWHPADWVFDSDFHVWRPRNMTMDPKTRRFVASDAETDGGLPRLEQLPLPDHNEHHSKWWARTCDLFPPLRLAPDASVALQEQVKMLRKEGYARINAAP